MGDTVGAFVGTINDGVGAGVGSGAFVWLKKGTILLTALLNGTNNHISRPATISKTKMRMMTGHEQRFRFDIACFVGKKSAALLHGPTARITVSEKSLSDGFVHTWVSCAGVVKQTRNSYK